MVNTKVVSTGANALRLISANKIGGHRTKPAAGTLPLSLIWGLHPFLDPLTDQPPVDGEGGDEAGQHGDLHHEPEDGAGFRHAAGAGCRAAGNSRRS